MEHLKNLGPLAAVAAVAYLTSSHPYSTVTIAIAGTCSLAYIAIRGVKWVTSH